MSSEILLTARGLGKRYQIYERPHERLLELISIGRKSYHRDFWALRKISFELRRGESLGILGRNGAGKSTLLQLLCGTITPTEGEVEVRGRISALLELGSGFNPELTGRENIFVYAAILGLSQSQIEQKLDDILAFADIGQFVELPVKTYSSGMFVRLAFAVAIHVEPDLLIVDEALSVGDLMFQQRCFRRIEQMRQAGMSILFVSHDIEMVKRFCNRAVILNNGEISASGHPHKVTAMYLAMTAANFDLTKLNFEENSDISEIERVTGSENLPESENKGYPDLKTMSLSDDAARPGKTKAPVVRHGDGTARIISVGSPDSVAEGVVIAVLERITEIIYEAEFFEDYQSYIFGLLIKDRMGTELIALNSAQEEFDVVPAAKGDKISFSFKFLMSLKPGEYSISVTLAPDQYSMTWMDWVDNALSLRVIDDHKSRLVFGVMLPAERVLSAEKMPGSDSDPRFQTQNQ